MKSPDSLKRSIILGSAVLAGLVVYAYGFQVTQVNLEATRSPRRQEQLVRILRALARPDLLDYEQDEFPVSTPILIPCPEGEPALPEPDRSGPYMILNPPCAEPRAEIHVEGFNFEPETEGPLSLIPPSGVTLQLDTIETDAAGHFALTVRLPRRQPTEEVQYIRAVTRRNLGPPHLSQTALDTWDKIIETVFLALLATTIGTALAVPASFFAARNLMKSVSSPLSSVALTILAVPVGLAAGAAAARWMGEISLMLNASVALNMAGLILSPLVVWGAARWALPQVDIQRPRPFLRAARLLALLLAAFAGILALFQLARLAETLGTALALRLGQFAFLGAFIADLGDILGTLIVLLTALAGAAVLGSAGGRLGQFLAERLPSPPARAFDLLLAAVAGATVVVSLGLAIDWLYQINDPVKTFWWPAAAGALAGLALALKTRPGETLPIGLAVYYVTRTIFNTLRSIEPLIMVIVFAVWVSIGPFAGVLALSLHTIAALAKLYSEQVESILPGPLEAVTATGATRLQMIVYAVLPQIIPPYISFTMYRWDINVRMSTIIGFAGGGGIGFLLQQNINLLNYRAASAQMLAIAIVVATMDYVSSRLRERAI